MVSTATNSEAAAIDSLSKRMDRLMDSKFAALDRMMRRLEETLARMDGAPSPVALVVAASAPSLVPPTSSAAPDALAAAPGTLLAAPTPLPTAAATASTPSSTSSTGAPDASVTAAPVLSSTSSLLSTASPASPNASAAVPTTKLPVVTPSPTSMPVPPLTTTTHVEEPTAPLAATPSRGAPLSISSVISSKLSTSSMGARKVFDGMALQQDVFTGAALDTTKHNHISVLSTAVSSMVAGSTEEKGDNMLQDFLRVRDRHIGKASAKRLRYLNKPKRCAAFVLDTHCPGSLSPPNQGLRCQFRTAVTNGEDRVFDRGKVVELTSWTAQKGGSSHISSQLVVCCQLMEWSVPDELWGWLVFDRRKCKKGCNMIFFQMVATHEVDAGLAEEDDYMLQGSLCVRDYVLSRCITSCYPPHLIDAILVWVATNAPENCNILEIVIELNPAMPWLPPKQDNNTLLSETIWLCFIFWPPFSCGWALLQQRPPWPPPVQLKKMLPMVFCRSVTKCKMKLLNSSTSELLMPSYTACVCQCDNCKTSMHGAYACCIQWKASGPPTPWTWILPLYQFTIPIGLQLAYEELLLNGVLCSHMQLMAGSLTLKFFGWVPDIMTKCLWRVGIYNHNWRYVTLLKVCAGIPIALDVPIQLLGAHKLGNNTENLLLWMGAFSCNMLQLSPKISITWKSVHGLGSPRTERCWHFLLSFMLYCQSSAFQFIVLTVQQRNESSSLVVSPQVMYSAILYQKLEKKSTEDFQLGACCWREGITCFSDSILQLTWSADGFDLRNDNYKFQLDIKISVTSHSHYFVLLTVDETKFLAHCQTEEQQLDYKEVVHIALGSCYAYAVQSGIAFRSSYSKHKSTTSGYKDPILGGVAMNMKHKLHLINLISRQLQRKLTQKMISCNSILWRCCNHSVMQMVRPLGSCRGSVWSIISTGTWEAWCKLLTKKCKGRLVEGEALLQLVQWDPGGILGSGLRASRISSGGECHVLHLGWAMSHGLKRTLGFGLGHQYIKQNGSKGMEQQIRELIFLLRPRTAS